MMLELSRKLSCKQKENEKKYFFKNRAKKIKTEDDLHQEKIKGAQYAFHKKSL